jgi:hypothetical protein
LEEAVEMQRRTLELMKEVLGPEHPKTLESMFGLAAFLGAQGKHEECGEMQRQALALRKKMLGPEYPFTLKGMLERAQGMYEESEDMHRRTPELMEKVLGPEHLDTTKSMNNLALVFERQDKYEETEEDRKAIERVRTH